MIGFVALIAAGAGALYLKNKGGAPVSVQLINVAKIAPKDNRSILERRLNPDNKANVLGFDIVAASKKAAEEAPARNVWTAFKKWSELNYTREYSNAHYWEAYVAWGRETEERNFKNKENEAIRAINEIQAVSPTNPIVRGYFFESGGKSLREYMFNELAEYLNNVEKWGAPSLTIAPGVALNMIAVYAKQKDVPFDVFVRAYRNVYQEMLKNPPKELSDHIGEWGTKLSIMIGAAYGANDGSALIK